METRRRRRRTSFHYGSQREYYFVLLLLIFERTGFLGRKKKRVTEYQVLRTIDDIYI